jgi:GH25 family lysozyme M1 (1,4-beta-N-acetylmuramidase)
MKLLFRLAPTVTAGLVLAFSLKSSSGASALGIAVSSFNGSINWSSVHSCGFVFGFAKSSEGVSFTDPNFQSNMTHGKAAGMQMGAYHFAHPEANCPAAEANYFWNVAGGQIIADGKSLFPAIDFEILNGHVCVTDYTTWLNNWATKVKAKTSHFLHPVAIVGCSGACALTTNTTLEEWGLDSGGPWKNCSCCNWLNPCTTLGWTYWLVSDNGAVCGVSGSVVINQYNGTLSGLISSQGVK